jgi:hypothetical protein
MAIDTRALLACYRTILRREPTEGEARLWSGPAAAARSAEDLIQALLVQATEVRSVLRLYWAVHGRMPAGLGPDAGGGEGVSAWTAAFRQARQDNPGHGYRDALALSLGGWLATPEFEALYGSGADTAASVRALYANVLRREADEEGVAHWVARIGAGDVSRARMVVEFTESDEFKYWGNKEADRCLAEAARAACAGPL